MMFKLFPASPRVKQGIFFVNSGIGYFQWTVPTFDLFFFNLYSGLFLSFYPGPHDWLWGHAWVRWHRFCPGDKSSRRISHLQFTSQSDYFLSFWFHCFQSQLLFDVVCMFDTGRALSVFTKDPGNMFSREQFAIKGSNFSYCSCLTGLQLSILVEFTGGRGL